MLSKDLMEQDPDAGGRRKAILDIYRVLYVRPDTLRDVRLDHVLAPSPAAAFTTASRLFPGAIILDIHPARKPRRANDYPDARFIRGKFHPVRNDDAPHKPPPAEA